MDTIGQNSPEVSGKRQWVRPQLTRVGIGGNAEGGTVSGVTEGGHASMNTVHYGPSAGFMTASSNAVSLGGGRMGAGGAASS